MKSNIIPIIPCLLLIVAGCKSIGPGQVQGDRFDYSAAIGDSWKSQTLLNIVKMRYVDPPIFVDVGQIVASRSLQQQVGAFANSSAVSGGFPSGTLIGNYGVNAQGIYTDQPTVTYTPLTGNKFVKSLMTPFTPESVIFTIQSGWPADGVLLMGASTINGLKNQQTTVQGTTPPEPEFLRVLALIRKTQLSGGLALRIHVDEQKHVTSLMTLRRDDISPETLADSLELRRLLKLDPNATEFTLLNAPTAANDREVAMQTRSVLQLMGVLAAHVDVPAQDLADHTAAPGYESAPGMTAAMHVIEIHSGAVCPPHAFVGVPYNGHWFWIDNRDLKSKRVFSFMMMMFTLADTTEAPPVPVLTIPAR